MATAPFDIGDDVILSGTFTVAGALTDPTTQTCTVIEPDGTETVVVLTRRSLGVFEGTFSAAKAGEHWYRFAGTGAAKAAGESSFQVRKRRVP